MDDFGFGFGFQGLAEAAGLTGPPRAADSADLISLRHDIGATNGPMREVVGKPDGGSMVVTFRLGELLFMREVLRAKNRIENCASSAQGCASGAH